MGYIWLGTKDGLNRLDGYEIKNFFYESDETVRQSNDCLLYTYTLISKDGDLRIKYGMGLKVMTQWVAVFTLIGLSDRDMRIMVNLSLRK